MRTQRYNVMRVAFFCSFAQFTLSRLLAVGQELEFTSGQTWVLRAALETPGGQLPFRLELTGGDGERKSFVLNGSERIEISVLTWNDERIVLGLEPYDSVIEALILFDGHEKTKTPILKGRWRKRAGADKWTELPFTAVPWTGHRFLPLAEDGGASLSAASVDGRWAVKFSGSDEPAVAVFRQSAGDEVEGTILTATGDYRYLSGSYKKGRLRLSCFDGAHAFLFDATVQNDGALKGDFWSRDTWHETWTARRDESAALPDGFELAKAIDGVALDTIRFPDLNGELRSLNDPAFRGKARIVEVFGTWCPNCNDAARYLVELDKKYRDRGLRIIGLAFELTGDFDRDAAQVRKFAAKHGIEYPLLLAGTSDKAKASRTLPLLDGIRAYPTTVFLDAAGKVRAVHTGFSGPATGEEYERMKERFEEVICALVGKW